MSDGGAEKHDTARVDGREAGNTVQDSARARRDTLRNDSVMDTHMPCGGSRGVQGGGWVSQPLPFRHPRHAPTLLLRLHLSHTLLHPQTHLARKAILAPGNAATRSSLSFEYFGASARPGPHEV